MARPLGGLGRALYGMLLGLVIGLFLIFAVFMNFITGGRPGSAEGTAEQKSQDRFMAMARDDWAFKLRDRDHVLGRVFVTQAVANEPKATLDGTVNNIKVLDKSIVRNVSVYNVLNQRVQPLAKPSDEVIKQVTEIANSIEDPLLKADAFRRIADSLVLHDQEAAKKYLKQAGDLVTSNPLAGAEQPGWFNNYMLLWPVGLAIFGFLSIFCLAQIVGSTGKAKTKLEEDEDDEEEEAPKAEVPVVDVPVEPAPMAEMPADAELVGSAPAAEEVPMATDVPLPPPSPLTKQSALSAAAAAQGAPAPTGNPDKKTMLARQGAAQATMLAKQGAATMLAKPGGGAAPTKVADSQEPMPLPDAKPPVNKTQKK